MRGNRNHNNNRNQNYNNNNNNNNNHRPSQTKLNVHGLRNSTAANDTDGGIAGLCSWLEKKSHCRISRSYLQGDIAVIFVNPNETGSFLNVNGQRFAGINVQISAANAPNSTQNNNSNNQSQNNAQQNHNNHTKQQDQRNGSQRGGRGGNRGQGGDTMMVEKNNAEADQVEAALVDFIQRNYDPGLKHLSLSNVPTAAQFIAIGLNQQPISKVFSAIFVCCETKVFETPLKRQTMVELLSLRANGLTTVKDCIAAAGTFNTIRGLDLSGNNISDVGELRYWRNRFPNLEELILTDNPIDGPETLKKMKQWYPKLKKYNGVAMEQLQAQIPAPTEHPTYSIELMPGHIHPDVPSGSDYGQPAPGKPGDQVIREQMALRFSYDTRLKLKLSEDALAANSFDFTKAKADLAQLVARGAIQDNDAFMWS